MVNPQEPPSPRRKHLLKQRKFKQNCHKHTNSKLYVKFKIQPMTYIQNY